ncbi:MAG: tRNA uridine-5-carboxymethylaminomethyl(34) synthesis enzyme MnmG, partial [Deltaproteobacteria bacterium]|nr:tRNA uridine-5-carboxymethylaminomethyl(34) synthesis enzyme MnmG [Deltaproteobacteria bacterium]
YQLLKRPQLTLAVVRAMVDAHGGALDVDDAVAARVTVEARYDGVLERARADVERERALVDEDLPDAIFARLAAPERMPGISNEVKEKLLRLRPRTLAQASRISGVTPAAVGLLALEARRVRSVSAG